MCVLDNYIDEFKDYVFVIKMKQNENKDRNQGTGCTFVIQAVQQPVEKEYFSHILNIQ